VTDRNESDRNEPDAFETDRQLTTIARELRHIRILLTCLLCLAVLSAAASVGGYLIDKFLPSIFWTGLIALVVFALYYGVRQVWKSGHDAARDRDEK
jgi:arginine exporter protein ArgO